MKALITILLILGALWIGKRIYVTYRSAETEAKSAAQQGAPEEEPAPAASPLAGLPESLEPSLSAAQKQGAAGLGPWLAQYRTHVRDPRLAAIELDYVVLINHQNPAEARRIFNEVKARTPTFSPIYDRVKGLESSFQ